jgi:hypothetical protein
MNNTIREQAGAELELIRVDRAHVDQAASLGSGDCHVHDDIAYEDRWLGNRRAGSKLPSQFG